MSSYDDWKTTPPEDDSPPDGCYFCPRCGTRGRGLGGWFEDGEPCGCCCDVCFEEECRCYDDNPEACAAWFEDHPLCRMWWHPGVLEDWSQPVTPPTELTRCLLDLGHSGPHVFNGWIAPEGSERVH